MSNEPVIAPSLRAVPTATFAHRRRFRWRGAAGAMLLAPAALAAIVMPPVFAEGSWPDFAIDAAAWIAFALGAVMRFWSTMYIGSRKQDVVVAEGPYSVCRNPLYVGSFLLAISGGLFLKSLIFTGALALVVVIYLAGTVPAEEEFLRNRLGSPYVEYCGRVPRYWPAWRLFRTPRRVDVDVQSLRQEWARASRWMWLPLVGEVMSHWRAHAGAAWLRWF